MLTLQDWRLYESVEIFSIGSEDFDFPEDEAGMDYDTAASQGWELAKKSPIHILSDKELNSVAILDGQVVGALFDSWIREQYSFDVVVSPQFQQQGIGKKLIDMAIRNYKADRDAYGDGAYMKVEVVNKNLVPLLTRYGFKIAKVERGTTIMTYGK